MDIVSVLEYWAIVLGPFGDPGKVASGTKVAKGHAKPLCTVIAWPLTANFHKKCPTNFSVLHVVLRGSQNRNE